MSEGSNALSREARDITVAEAAAILGVSTRTVRRLIERGALPRVGGTPIRVPREAVEVLARVRAALGRDPFTRPRGRPRKQR